MNVISKIIDEHDVKSRGGVSTDVIEGAEFDLGFTFSHEYRLFLQQYGSIEYNGEIILGLGTKGYRNTVVATKDERELSDKFPLDYCVLYNLGIDSILILLKDDGNIYEYRPTALKRIYASFSEWLDREFFKN